MTGDRIPWLRPAHPLDEHVAPPVTATPLDRGIVWSDLVAEMEAERGARRSAGVPEPGRVLGDAA